MINRGTTTIMVSHQIKQIEDMCKNVLWLENGCAKMVGETKAICNIYKNMVR